MSECDQCKRRHDLCRGLVPPPTVCLLYDKMPQGYEKERPSVKTMLRKKNAPMPDWEQLCLVPR